MPKVTWWWRGSSLARSCCPAWPSRPSPSRRSNRRGEAGAATVAAAAMVATLLSLTGGGFLLGGAVIARHRAQAVADLAALAGASGVPAGPASACEQAVRLGSRMRAGEINCAVEGLDVVIAVAIPVPGWRFGPARAAARAGPAG
ncbi:flp pilus-assembly TadE/G-like family protein [Mycolicibacter arupensis]|nr:flp pilus-assembly TadE/G-like family protein [Mycolicibacter arupensis]